MKNINWAKFWFIPWTMGWLFTLGISPASPESWNKAGWWIQSMALFVSYFVWPLILGAHFAK